MSAPYPDKAQEAVYPPQQPVGYPLSRTLATLPRTLATLPSNKVTRPRARRITPVNKRSLSGINVSNYVAIYFDAPSSRSKTTNGVVFMALAAPQTTTIVRTAQAQPNDYLAFAIFVTVCCCLPFGIVGIVKSMDVRNRYTSGDYAGAEEASRSAKNWSLAGLITGIVLEVLGVILIIVYYVVILSVATSSISYGY